METDSAAATPLAALAKPPEAGIQAPQAFTLDVTCRMADELAARLAAATLITHRGENGRARENLIREFFASLLPKGFSRLVLREALDNGATVKGLDRTGGSRNYVVFGGQRGEDIDPDRHDHQVFTAVVASDWVSIDTVRDELNSWLPAHPRRQWFNSIAVLGKFSTAYMPRAPRVDQTAATELGFALGDEDDQRNTPTDP